MNTPFVDISPLENLEDYYKLSEDELVSRYTNVVNNLFVFAGNLRAKRKTSVEFLLQEVLDYQRAADFNESSFEDKKMQEVKLARKAVEIDELCGTVLDRLVALCITKGSIENVKDKRLLEILREWESSVGNLENTTDPSSKIYTAQPCGLPVIFEYIVERLFVDGDAFISEVWGDKVPIHDEDFVIPYKIKVHDTLLVDYDRDEFAKTGREKAFLDLNKENRMSFSGKTKKERVDLYSNDHVFTTHLKLRPKTFYFWGTSYFKRAFQPISHRKRIEALEIETIEGMIHRLTIIKAGKIDPDTESGIVAPHRLALLESLLSQPKANSIIMWPGDDLEIEEIVPRSDVLTYENKYKATNEQTLAALGIPRVLIDGLESSTQNWQKFLGVISILDKVRNNYLLPWINRTLRKICVENGYEDEFPKYSFSRLKLYDLKQLLDAVKLFYDRGLMSELSALVNGDLDFDIEKSRREYEKEFGIVSNFGGPGYLPFSKNTPDGDNKDGRKSPDNEIKKDSSVEASLKESFRDDLIQTFEMYLFALHDLYAKRIYEQLLEKEYDSLPGLFFAYRDNFKRDIRKQMEILFRQEISGFSIDDSLLNSSITWVNSFFDGYVDYLEEQVSKIVENNIGTKEVLVASLVAGFMEEVKTKRLRLYSSSIYNKAVSAGGISELLTQGKDRVLWKCSLTENSCEWCESMHNKVLSLEEFFANFPPHPNCECSYEETEDGLSLELPKKDPSNWGKILHD